MIGPTTFTLDGRMAEADPDRAAMCLAHELKHMLQRGRRWPGIVGTLMLDLRARDVLSLEWETAIFETHYANGSAASVRQRVPTQEDLKEFYPESQISPLNMNLRRLGAAVLLVGAYLAWPRMWKKAGPTPLSEERNYRPLSLRRELVGQ